MDRIVGIVLKTIFLSVLFDTVLATITFDEVTAMEVEATLQKILEKYSKDNDLFSTKDDALFKMAEYFTTQAMLREDEIVSPNCDNGMPIKIDYITSDRRHYWFDFKNEAKLFIFPKKTNAEKGNIVQILHEAENKINSWEIKNLSKIAVVCLEDTSTGVCQDAIAIFDDRHTDIWGSRRLNDISSDLHLHLLTVRRATRLAITDNPSPPMETEHRTTLTEAERKLNAENIEKLRELSEKIRNATPANHNVIASASYISHMKWDETQLKIVSTGIIHCLVLWEYQSQLNNI